jgi:hypothetical protein
MILTLRITTGRCFRIQNYLGPALKRILRNSLQTLTLYPRSILSPSRKTLPHSALACLDPEWVTSETRNNCKQQRHCTRNVTLTGFHVTTVATAEQYLLYILSGCLCIQLIYPGCKAHYFCAALYWHLWPACFYHIFPHYPTNSTILGKKVIEIKRVFRFSRQGLSEKFLMLRRTQQDIFILTYGSPCTVPAIIARFKSNFNFLIRFSLNPQIPNVMKTHPAVAELFHADGRTDGRTDG